MFAKSTLASAVAVALGASAVSVQTAQADVVLFPYFNVGETVTTVITTVNTAPDGGYYRELTNEERRLYGTPGFGDPALKVGGSYTPALHYRVYWKSSAEDAILSPCLERDEWRATSENDLQTFDLSGHFGADTQAVLFNDPSSAVLWKDAGTSFAFAKTLGDGKSRGYLTVDNGWGSAFGAIPTVTGEAFVFDFSAGAVWGYQGVSRTTGGLWGRTSINADYRDESTQSPTNMNLMPFAETTTKLFVTPVSEFMAGATNSYRARVWLNDDYFDRDEGRHSGTVAQDVVCVGAVKPASLITDAENVIPDGGWATLNSSRVVYNSDTASWVRANFRGVQGNLIREVYATDLQSLCNVVSTSVADVNVPGSCTETSTTFGAGATSGAIITKLDYNVESTFNGEPVEGVFNNGFRMEPGIGTWQP